MKNALIILDIQKDFVGENARMPVAKHQIEPMLKNINTIIDTYKLKNIPVLYIGNEFEKNQYISNWFRNKASMKGTEGATMDERLLIINKLYFSKKVGSAFSNSNFVGYLQENKIEHLTIVGLYAEGCVTATVKGALQKTMKVTVVKDAVAGASDMKREKSLSNLSSKGVFVVSTKELLS